MDLKTRMLKGDPKWFDSILFVLDREKRPMHYIEIADIIARERIRSRLGATPAATVSYNLTSSANRPDGDVIRDPKRPGVYALREWSATSLSGPEDDSG